MSSTFNIPESLIKAVMDVQEKEVSKHAAFGYVTEKKMDPVNKKALKKDFDDREDKDIDNDGDSDDSDEYLHNRRKAISKSMSGKKDKVEMNPKDKADSVKEEVLNEDDYKVGDKVKCKASGMHGTVSKVDPDQTGAYYTVKREDGKMMKYAPNELSAVAAEGKESGLENPDNCATHVYSEQWGDGTPVKTMHAEPDEVGRIAWYDVMFEHGIEKRVPIEELKVIKSSHHGHKKRGK